MGFAWVPKYGPGPIPMRTLPAYPVGTLYPPSNTRSNPSPRTLVPKKYISGLGTNVDEQRCQHLRMDDDTCRELVEASRRLIFQQGVGITGAKVEERLQGQSLTPTRV